MSILQAAELTRTILLFGDSHSDAVRRAAAIRTHAGKPTPLVPQRRMKLKDGRRMGDTKLRHFLGRISKLGRDDVVVSMIGGSQYSIFSTVQHPQPFDFYEPDGPGAPDAGATIIPYRAVSELVRMSVVEGIDDDGFRIKGDAADLEALRTATSARLIHILPPPPIHNGEAIRERHERIFADQGISTFGVCAPQLRLKFWTLQATLLQELCETLGIEVLGPPAEALSEGFLRPEFHQGGAHANELYGELLLRQIEAKFI
jgi:hypothetical protein